MNYPYVAFCVDRKGQLVISHQRDPARTTPFEMEIPLAELKNRGLEDAAHSVGLLVFGLLSKWYPEEFKEHAALIPEMKTP